jgi:D-alanyl-lipoteichoic acid acyltransferase DltB (MBOAT superfamily)
MPLQTSPHRQTGAPPRAPHRRFVELVVSRAEVPRGLYDDEPATARRDLLEFLRIVARLALLVAVFAAYHLEGRAFLILAGLTLAALPVHYLLPFRWKQPFFLAASLAGLALVFGPQVAAFVTALGVALIGVCYLPLPWAARAGLIALAASAMAAARARWLHLPVPDLVWPVLASMCMFRMIIFLYEIKHSPRREPIGDVLSYFFLLPNYAFLHFPVVNFRTLQQGYFASDIHATQRAGLRMMLRGTIHLLLYRLVYHRLLISPDEVHNLASLAAYLVCNYLLYLRVSGQFHMACGMLHLFGYQLPETHHHYLLASGFTDYWRRINIYWKDFMVRVVFLPTMFRLKKWPQPRALAAATAVVFIVTWALHGYQSFWLRGHWSLSLPDVLFWGILGLLVIVNVQQDARTSRARRGKSSRRGALALAIRAGKTLGTFATICLLWSLWSSSSVARWLSMLRRAWP